MAGNWRTAMIRGELLVRVKAIVESNAAKTRASPTSASSSIWRYATR